jgi:hypothetical protein
LNGTTGGLSSKAEIESKIRKRARQEDEAARVRLKSQGVVTSTVMIARRPRKEDVLGGRKSNGAAVEFVTVPLDPKSVKPVELALANRAAVNAGVVPVPKKRRLIKATPK